MVFIEREPEKQTALLLRMLLLLFSMQITIVYDLRTLKRIFKERKGLQSLGICPILPCKLEFGAINSFSHGHLVGGEYDYAKGKFGKICGRSVRYFSV